MHSFGQPMHSPRRNVYLPGAGVTPAQGRVKPAAGFTYNESSFILISASGGADVPIRVLLQPLRSRLPRQSLSALPRVARRSAATAQSHDADDAHRPL